MFALCCLRCALKCEQIFIVDSHTLFSLEALYSCAFYCHIYGMVWKYRNGNKRNHIQPQSIMQLQVKIFHCFFKSFVSAIITRYREKFDLNVLKASNYTDHLGLCAYVSSSYVDDKQIKVDKKWENKNMKWVSRERIILYIHIVYRVQTEKNVWEPLCCFVRLLCSLALQMTAKQKWTLLYSLFTFFIVDFYNSQAASNGELEQKN